MSPSIHFVKLKNPKVVITEWIPFGKNYMTEFIDRVTLREYQKKRIKYFTEVVDNLSTIESVFKASKYYTKVNIIDFEPEAYVKFIAEVDFEKEGIFQKKDVFIYVDYLGRCIYASEIENAEDEEGYISLDNLAFIIPDMIIDSSKMIKSLIASSQRYILETLYGQYKVYKHVSIITETIFEINENTLAEVRQVIGNIKRIIDIGEGKLIFGEFGLLLMHPNPKKFENFISCYSFIRSIVQSSQDLFFKLNNISTRLERLSNILTGKIDMETMGKLRNELSEIDKELAVIEIVSGYLKEISSLMNEERYLLKFSGEDVELLKILNAKNKLKKLNNRITEIENAIRSNLELATSLTRLSTTLSDNLQSKISNQLAESVKHQVAIGEAMELLEAGIFGVYALEAIHILMLMSGKEHELMHYKVFGFPIPFWIVLFAVVFGIYIGKKILEYRKRKVLEEYLESHKT
jgi:hypothetical protein